MIRLRRMKCWKLIVLAMFLGALILCIVVWVHVSESSHDKFLAGSLQFIKESKVITLAKLNVDASAVTLSGFSAGGAMANQLHVAHSASFSGAAIFSQVFYRCGPKNVLQFGIQCSQYGMQWFPYNVQYAIDDTKNYAKDGLIDDLKNLENNKVFVWTGGADEYIPRALAEKNKEFYETFISNQSRISLIVNEPAKHLLPTTSFGAACDADASQNYYLGNCNYSGAYHALHFLLGDKVSEHRGIRLSCRRSDETGLYGSNLRISDQRRSESEFYTNGNIRDAAMGPVGFIYIPKKCEDGTVTCLLHFNLHGCNEYPPQVAREYILNNDFLPVAEANNIIVVFPLTTKVPSNMDGCWDFYSYTGSDFATKNGKQVQVVFSILQRILQGQRSPMLIV